MELSLRLVEELALLLVLAAGLAYGLARLHLPPVLGYLLAGVVAGPSGFGWVREAGFVQVLGDLGVVLIMFGLGLDFDLDRLRRRATLSVAAGVASVLVTFVAVNAAAVLLGFAPLAALFLAAAFSICGTAVNLRILGDLGHLKREYGAPIAAILVVTDIAAILLLTALSGVALGGGLDALTVAISLLKAVAFLVLAPAFGFLVVPRLLNVVTVATRSREVLLITTLALCFGLALLSQRLGFSLALGAFVMGMVVSEARVYHPIEEMIKPIEQIFGTLFFLSVGLSVRLADALPYWPAVLVILAIITATKLVAVAPMAYLSGFTGLAALAAAWGLVPVGEFSFVIVNEGVRFGALPREVLAVAVVIALATAALAVVGLRTTRAVVAGLTDRLPAGALNLLTVLQLRSASLSAVPGLAEATADVRAGRLGGAAGYAAAGVGSAAAGAWAAGEATAAVAAPAVGAECPFDPELNRRAVWHQVQEIGINAVIVVTITLALAGISGLIAPLLPPAADIELVLAGLALVLCAPSAIFIFRCGASLARLLSQALAERLPWMDSGVMRGALVAAGSFALFVFLQIAFLPLLLLRFKSYNGPVLIGAVGLTLALAYFLYRALRDFQRGLTGLVRSSLSTSGRAAARQAGAAGGAARDPAAAAARAAAAEAVRAPYRTMIAHFTVPAGSPLAGRALGDAGLGEQAGVTVLGIERDGEWIGNPDAGARLAAGDVLVVIGSQEQRDRAEQLVEEPAPAPAAGSSPATAGAGPGGRGTP
jgi:Kef-type K+ transport system membrane component KefB